MDLIGKKNIQLMERLIDIKPQNIPPQGLIMSSTDNEKIESLVNTITETGLDYIINERIDPVGNEDIDKEIEEIKQSYYRLIKNLKKLGYIEIHGIQVRKKTNI